MKMPIIKILVTIIKMDAAKQKFNTLNLIYYGLKIHRLRYS